MTENREQVFHHMGSKKEIFIFRGEDGKFILRTESEGPRVLRDDVNPIETEVTREQLKTQFGNSSLWKRIEAALV